MALVRCIGTFLWPWACGSLLPILVNPGHSRRSSIQRAFAWYELWICLAGLATVLGRFLGWSGWSARIWPYSLAFLALAGALAYRVRSAKLPPWLISQMRVLALANQSPRMQQPGLRGKTLVGSYCCPWSYTWQASGWFSPLDTGGLCGQPRSFCSLYCSHRRPWSHVTALPTSWHSPRCWARTL